MIALAALAVLCFTAAALAYLADRPSGVPEPEQCDVAGCDWRATTVLPWRGRLRNTCGRCAEELRASVQR